MKKGFLLILLIVFASISFAQIDPVSWSFSAKKVADKVYEIQMVATIKPGWHLYSQVQPKDAIALPTKFSFTKSPLIVMDAKVKEVGSMQKFHDASIGASAYQYSKSVKFIQKVTLKANVKTAVSGTVEYQTCDDKRCLPPKKVPFTVNVV